MQWDLEVKFYTRDGWHIGHCPALEIKSQGRTEAEAKDNLQEALFLFFEHASYSEVMSYLSKIPPSSKPKAWFGKPLSSLGIENSDQDRSSEVVTLAYA